MENCLSGEEKITANKENRASRSPVRNRNMKGGTGVRDTCSATRVRIDSPYMRASPKLARHPAIFFQDVNSYIKFYSWIIRAMSYRRRIRCNLRIRSSGDSVSSFSTTGARAEASAGLFFALRRSNTSLEDFFIPTSGTL